MVDTNCGGNEERCEECGGLGELFVDVATSSGEHDTCSVVCGACDGTGEDADVEPADDLSAEVSWEAPL